MTSTSGATRGVLYYGRFTPSLTLDWPQFDDAAPTGALTESIANAQEVRIEDPLSFPWESVGEIEAPTTIELDGLSLLDLAALAPVLETLTAGDRIESTDPAIGQYIAHNVGTHIDDQVSSGPTPASSVEKLSRTKASELAHRRIVQRLSETTDADTAILSIAAERLGSHSGGLGALIDEETKGRADEVLELWGVRAEPGATLDGVVISYRTR